MNYRRVATVEDYKKDFNPYCGGKGNGDVH